MAFLSVERLREDAMAPVDRQQRSFLRRDFMRGVLAGAGAVAAHGAVWRKAAWADPAACDGSNDLALVNGKILMKDRQLRTLDAAQVLADARRLSVKVREAAGR